MNESNSPHERLEDQVERLAALLAVTVDPVTAAQVTTQNSTAPGETAIAHIDVTAEIDGTAGKDDSRRQGLRVVADEGGVATSDEPAESVSRPIEESRIAGTSWSRRSWMALGAAAAALALMVGFGPALFDGPQEVVSTNTPLGVVQDDDSEAEETTAQVGGTDQSSDIEEIGDQDDASEERDTEETVAEDAPTENSSEAESVPQLDAAPLGTYVVARPNAGISRNLSPLGAGYPTLEIPVYDEPFGEPRVLLDQNAIDRVERPLTLANPSSSGGALVLRVIAGGPDDEWIQVQAPSRPHDRYIWARSSDFDFGFTTKRIEIDLASDGSLELIDGDQVLVQSEIVQGRASRPTPVHVTYLQDGVDGRSLSPAYGSAMLAMASFSEVIGTFGGDHGLPSNYLHGTNLPDLMGQRVSSGEIRVPNDTIDALVGLTGLGTPVVLFDSSAARPGRDEVMQRRPQLAATMSFDEATSGVATSIAGVELRLWQRCPEGQVELLCRTSSHPNETAFVTARAEAGEFNEELNSLVLPVYDRPGGEARMLVYRNDVDGQDLRYPLLNPSRAGEPLVLRVVSGTADDEFVQVQAPIRPHRTTVWVRSADFVFGSSTKRIEVDLAGPGSLTVYANGQVVLTSGIVSGRESRPTTLTDSYVDQVLDGAEVSPAYGPFVASWPAFSYELGTFGGGRLPKQAVHGTNQPELMGERVSSGKIRVPNEVMTQMVELAGGIVGAQVVVFDSSVVGRDQAITRLEIAPWTPAQTIEPTAELAIGEPLF